MVQYTPFTVPLVIVAVMGFVSAAFTWRKQDNRAEFWMTFVMLNIAVWAAVHLVLVSATSYGVKRAMITVAYPVGVCLPVTMLIFTLHYTGRKSYLTTPRVVGLLAVPVTLLAFTHVNPDGLAFVGVEMDPEAGPFTLRGNTLGPRSYALLNYEWGPITYTYAAWSHVVAVVFIYMLSMKFKRSRNIYRKMSFILLMTAVTMFSANVITFLGESPFPHMMLLPFCFIFFGFVAVGATVSVRFVQLTPIDKLLSAFSSFFGSLVPLARDIVIEEIDSGVVVLDEDNRIVDVNSTGKRMIAPESERIVGRKITDVVNEDLFVKHGSELLEPGTTGRFESVWVEGADSETRCYDVKFNEISTGSGGSAGARVALIHDITAQQRRKRELEDKNERLENFASIVSHDLRNPLNVAEGYVDMIEAEADDPIEEYANEVDISHDRMKEIIENVLVLARQGDAVDDTEELAVDELVHNAWENVDTFEATFESTFEEGSTVEADRASLLRVFENLFRNAIEHNSNDVTIRVGELDAGAGLYVEDTGSGIPEAERDQVFEHAYTTEDDGTGYGLSIVEDIVESHGWEIAVTESDEGGARFEISDVTVWSSNLNTPASSSPPP